MKNDDGLSLRSWKPVIHSLKEMKKTFLSEENSYFLSHGIPLPEPSVEQVRIVSAGSQKIIVLSILHAVPLSS
jgi:hypothetical protein